MVLAAVKGPAPWYSDRTQELDGNGIDVEQRITRHAGFSAYVIIEFFDSANHCRISSCMQGLTSSLVPLTVHHKDIRIAV